VKDKTDYTLDVRGAISPFSLLKVSLVFQNMRPEEVVEILGCDSEMLRDLLRVLPANACEVVLATPEDTDPDGARVWLKKNALTTAL
jgi:TusA-related sulfurtransferase